MTDAEQATKRARAKGPRVSAKAAGPDDPHAEAERALKAACPRLSAVIDRVGPCRIGASAAGTTTAHAHFVGLVRAIASQQLSSKAADTIFARIEALGPGGVLPEPEALLALPEQALRDAGLSGAKTRGVRDLAARVASGSLRLDTIASLDDEQVIESLCEVSGIGRWTAEMFLMFRLGRPDVLPLGDLGIKKGMQALFSLRALPEPEKMTRLARPWRPHRTIACWYLWRLLDPPAKP